MPRPTHGIRAFSITLFLLWISISTITVILELIPAHFSPLFAFIYNALKIALFFTLGYLTPITFWRFDKLSYGFCFAAVSATAVEILQSIVRNGHRLSWIELLAKLSLIGLGFVFALDARYERTIKMGRMRLALFSEHLPEHD